MSPLGRRYFDHNDVECSRVNIGEEDELLIKGYVPSLVRLIGLAVLLVLSGGVLVILFSWWPSLKARLANRRCSLEQAQLLILRVCDRPQSEDAIIIWHCRTNRARSSSRR